jgi:UDP-2,3-diacylglucosamine pyrophosphatase LpxH
MASPKTHDVTRHRTLWLSDLHLGSPGCKAKRLVRFLRQNDCDELYLVGDIFDGWKLKTKFFWTPDHTRVIKAILAKARRGTRVYYLTGNHDAFMRQFVRNKLRLGRVRLMHERVHTTADGRRLLVQHGDKYDAVVSNLPGLALAGDFAYEAVLKLSDRLTGLQERFNLAPGFSLSAFLKTGVKSFVQYLSGFDDQVYHECRRRRLHGVVCGHTHHAEVRHVRNGVTSYNCGDWVESCSALAEDAHGRIRVLQAVPDRPKLVSLTPRVVGLAPRRERAAAAPAAKEVQTAA